MLLELRSKYPEERFGAKISAKRLQVCNCFQIRLFSSKLNFTCFEEQFGCKLKRKNSDIEKGFHQKTFGWCCQNCILSVQRNIYDGKIQKLQFFSNFFSDIEQKTFPMVWSKLILTGVEIHFGGKVSDKKFVVYNFFQTPSETFFSGVLKDAFLGENF